MRIRRTIPPSAVPLSFRDLGRGLSAICDNKVIEEIENDIKDFFGTRYAFLVSSGKAALALILMCLKRMRDKRKVIIPAYTCYSVPSAVALAGLDIVLCDLMPETLDYDFARLEELADEETLCIVSTHLFGIPSDVSRAREIARKHGIYVIEDAAQAMGNTRDGEILGTIGDAGFFSLGRGKNITCGSGGIIVTSSEEIGCGLSDLYCTLRAESPLEYAKSILEVVLMTLFSSPYLYWFPCGLPFLGIGETRFHETFPIYGFSRFKAGLLHGWREKLEACNNVRRVAGRYYIDRLELGRGGQIHADDRNYLRFPLYVVHGAWKDQLCRGFGFLGISPMYPDSINNVAEIRARFRDQRYDNAERIARTLVTLPTHDLASDHDKARICHAVRDLLPDRDAYAAPNAVGS